MPGKIFRTTAVLFVFCGLPGFAAVHFYSDRGSWTTAVQNLSSVPLSGIAPAGGVADFSNSTGTTVAGVTFTAPAADLSAFSLAVVDPAFNPAVYDWGDGPVLRGSAPIGNGKQANLAYGLMRIALPSGITAGSLDYMAASGNAEFFIFQLSTGDRFTIKSAASPQPSFFGFVCDTPVADIRLASSSQPLVSNISIGQTNGPVARMQTPLQNRGTPRWNTGPSPVVIDQRFSRSISH
jgi:hypothetical protein